MTRYLDAMPHPWTKTDIRTAIFKDFTKVTESIENTEGGVLWRFLADLEDVIWIFQSSCADLLDEICVFGERSRSPHFWNYVNSGEIDGYTRNIKKKLYVCTSALMTVVEVARTFQNKYPVADFDAKRSLVFSTVGLHDFLQGLRNYNTHWRIAEANWRIETSKEARIARFVVEKHELLAWGNWTVKAKKFITDTPDFIDLYAVLTLYRSHIQDFYAWHKGAVLDNYATVISQYFQYKSIHEGINHGMYWNMLISNLPKGLNPYQYLGRYLREPQLQVLLSLEHRSEQQVDALIQMLGMSDYCDSSLREKVLKLFNVSTSEG